MSAYRLRTQAEIEDRLYQIIEQLPDVDRNNAERVSWHCAQIVALLYALGASERRALHVMYRLWRLRHQSPELQAASLATVDEDRERTF